MKFFLKFAKLNFIERLLAQNEKNYYPIQMKIGKETKCATLFAA